MVEEASTLDETHIQCASTLMDYYLAEIQRLTEQEPVNSRCEEADRLLAGWYRKAGPNSASATSIATALVLPARALTIPLLYWSC